jgi:serine/threonine protein kinase
MIMEAAMGGELLNYTQQMKTIDECVARNILQQVIQAMIYCHSRGVVHRDLKLENVLFKNENFEEDFFVKVVDFGIAGVGGDRVDAGTLLYMAPECLEKVAAKTTPAIDVWAIGVMFYAMLYGELPFNDEDEKELIRKIKSEPVKFPNTVPVTDGAKDAIRRMLEKDPANRIELLDFVDLPYNLLEQDEL